MQRKKRDPSQRAYARGFRAGCMHLSRDMCPYHANLNTRETWLSGWRRGRAQWQTYTKHSSAV